MRHKMLEMLSEEFLVGSANENEREAVKDTLGGEQMAMQVAAHGRKCAWYMLWDARVGNRGPRPYKAVVRQGYMEFNRPTTALPRHMQWYRVGIAYFRQSAKWKVHERVAGGKIYHRIIWKGVTWN